jgi:hypothetical protein
MSREEQKAGEKRQQAAGISGDGGRKYIDRNCLDEMLIEANCRKSKWHVV